ncbi:MAG: short subunit dehydrogenase-like uncharacterized protein [Oceanicoccus sp.]|jgi:short subunit dehydrogenase-like uncharacterized protein
MSDKEREFEIILWGASGFTGRLVAEYLYTKYGNNGKLRWAIGGRNKKKLETLSADLTGDKNGLSVVIANSNDEESLKELTARTQVVCTTVGPYALYGTSLVGACVDNGTHYCDLTGEVLWMDRTIKQFQSQAELTGARIVHTCGFDSIPSDMGVYFLQRQMRAIYGVPARHIKYGAKSFAGGFSGGTVYSMINMLDEIQKKPALQKSLDDPYLLNPEGSYRGDDTNEKNTAVYDNDFKSWTSPFPMALINTRVVRRSNALMDDAYGKDFRYDESTLSESSIKAHAAAFGSLAMMGSMAVSPIRKLLQGFLPSPGQGPSKEKRDNGFYEIHFHGVHPTDRSKDMRAIVTGDMDPGYGSTSKMLAECAVCLVKDDIQTGGGFWTPASAMGDTLLDRLQDNAGLRFTIVDSW